MRREKNRDPYQTMYPKPYTTFAPYLSNHGKWFGIIHAKPWFVKSFICMKNCQIIGNNSDKFVISLKKFYNVLKNQKTRKHGLLLFCRGIIDRFVIFFNFRLGFFIERRYEWSSIECRSKWFERPLCNAVQHTRHHFYVMIKNLLLFFV